MSLVNSNWTCGDVKISQNVRIHRNPYLEYIVVNINFESEELT